MAAAAIVDLNFYYFIALGLGGLGGETSTSEVKLAWAARMHMRARSRAVFE
jgi:hypothetical protein